MLALEVMQNIFKFMKIKLRRDTAAKIHNPKQSKVCS